MVLTNPFHCPTRVVEGHAYDEVLANLISERSWALITSPGWESRGVVDRISTSCSVPSAIISGVEPNPRYTDLPVLAAQLPDVDILVAIGGGSVIDAAKATVALQSLNDIAPLMSHLRDGVPLPTHMSPIPIVAVPTTSGTGSEVTCWGTIWDDDGTKCSVNDPRFYPSHAVLDPELCLSMPRDLTLFTGLDALSHAMESVWNRRHMPVSDTLAAEAISVLRNDLEAVLSRPSDIKLRRNIQNASLLAGLAMGTTQTALAHSISYPFTAHFNVPHGLACSFTLAEVARYNLVAEASRLAPIATGLGCRIDEIPVLLEDWFRKLGVGEAIASYISPQVVDGLGDSLITRSRAANNLREADGPAARKLACSALQALSPVDTGRTGSFGA